MLAFIFGVFLTFMATRIMVDLNKLGSKSSAPQESPRQARIKADADILKSQKTIVLGAGLSFFGGLASGFLGVGGGVLVVPIIMCALDMSIHIATATSMFTMVFTSITAVPKYYVESHIDIGICFAHNGRQHLRSSSRSLHV